MALTDYDEMLAYGAGLFVEADAGLVAGDPFLSLTELGKLLELDAGEETINFVKIYHLKIPNRCLQYRSSICDLGEVSFNLFWSSGGQAAMRLLSFVDGAHWQIVCPLLEGEATPAHWDFFGSPSKTGRGKFEEESAVMSPVTLKITKGSMVFTAAVAE